MTPDHGIRLLCWADYIDPACLEAFTRETGVGVELAHVESDTECVRRITDGEAHDVVMIGNYAAEVLIGRGLARPLDMRRLPNFANVTDPRFGAPVFDPGKGGAKYTAVNFWGTTGFAVVLDRVQRPVNSWKMLFDDAHAGRITLVADAREVYAPALYLLGSDCNCTDEATIDKATTMLLAQRRLVRRYTSNDDFGLLLDEGAAIVQCWNGDVASALKRGETGLAFMLPQEGYSLWMDAPFIPAGASDPESAHLLLDFLMRLDIAAANAEYSGYPPAISAADKLLRSLVQRSLRPLESQLARGVFQRDLGPEVDRLYEDGFAKVQAL